MSGVRLKWTEGKGNDSSSDSESVKEIDEENFIIRPDGIHCPNCDELVSLGFLGTIHERPKKEYPRGGMFRMGKIEIECGNVSCPLTKKKIELEVSLTIR